MISHTISHVKNQGEKQRKGRSDLFDFSAAGIAGDPEGVDG